MVSECEDSGVLIDKAFSMNSSPFAHLNLMFNPFGSLTNAEVSKLIVPVLNLEDLATFLNTHQNVAIQFFGDKGRGKTTHLIALHKIFPNAPIIFLERNKAKPTIPQSKIVFVDGVHKLWFWRRWKLWKQPQSIIFTSHFDYKKEFKNHKSNFLSFEIKNWDLSHLHQILTNRIEMATENIEHSVPRISLETLEKLHQKYGDNFRGIIFELYDIFQNLNEVKDV